MIRDVYEDKMKETLEYSESFFARTNSDGVLFNDCCVAVCLEIDVTFRQNTQLLICHTFLFQNFLQDALHVSITQQSRVALGRSIGRDFIMAHALNGADDGSVARG